MMKNNGKKRFNKTGLIIKRLIIQTVIVTLLFGIGSLIYLNYDYNNWAESYYRYIEGKNKDLIIKLQEYETKNDYSTDMKNFEDLLLGSTTETPDPDSGYYIKLTDRENGENLADSKERCFFLLLKDVDVFEDDPTGGVLLYESDDENLVKWMKDIREEYLSFADEEDENHLFYQVNKYCIKDGTFYPLEMIAYYRPDFSVSDINKLEKDKYETWCPKFDIRDYETIEGMDEMEVKINRDNEGVAYLVGGMEDESDFPEKGKDDPKNYKVSYGESHTYEFEPLENYYFEQPEFFFKNVETMIIIRDPFIISKSMNGKFVVKNYVLESYFKANYWTEGSNIFTRKIILAVYCLIIFLNTIISIVLSLIIISKAEKEEFRRSLTDSISHDLRSPLTALRGYAESLKENLNEDKKEIYADAILESVDYMDRLIKGNLELLRLQNKRRAGDKEKCDLVEITGKLFEKYIPFLEERNITLTVKGDYIKNVNRILFSNAIENLVSNSVKYVNDSGEIIVEGKKNAFIISNTVDVFPDKKGEELWEAFVKGNEARSNEQGSGVGLAIAKSVFEIHKIKADIEYEDGEKKKFGVYIY